MTLDPFKCQIRNFLMRWFQALWIWRQLWELALFPCYVWPALLCGRVNTVSEICEENEKSREDWEREGKEKWTCTSFLLCRAYIFSVTACISTHKGLCFFVKEITCPEKLIWQMWPRMCVCKTRYEVLYQVPWVCPGPAPHHTHLTGKEHLIGYTWSVWYSEASDRLSEKLRKFSWYSEQTIS